MRLRIPVCLLAGALSAASPAAAEVDAEIIAITTNVVDCSVDVVVRVEDAAEYFVNMWDDGAFLAGAGGAFAANAIVRVRFTLGGPISQVAPGVGVYVADAHENGKETYATNGAAQAWSSELGTACQNAGETFSAAVVSEEFPTGTKLVLKGGNKPALSLLSKDSRVALGRGPGSADDPTVNGGSLRVVSTAMAPFDDTYTLPADGWRPLSTSKPEAGFRFKGSAADAIRSVIVRPGKQLKIKGKGPGLGHDLATDPETVLVELRLGERRYCMRFGGTASFDAGQTFEAVAAPADEWSCPPPLP